MSGFYPTTLGGALEFREPASRSRPENGSWPKPCGRRRERQVARHLSRLISRFFKNNAGNGSLDLLVYACIKPLFDNLLLAPTLRRGNRRPPAPLPVRASGRFFRRMSGSDVSPASK